MEQSANQVTLIGCPVSAPQFYHSNHGRHFYSFWLEVARLSGTIDRLPILASETLLEQTELGDGEAMRVTGQIRSFNNHRPNERRLVISVLAETLELTDEPQDNRVTLLGTVCRPPVYRRTPLGREICDIMLAVNRAYRRSDYLPCILWGQNAQAAQAYPVGMTLLLTGRMQSRDYLKRLPDRTEQRTAFEISAISAEPVE